jgi:glucose/arabinose dehydrogenase
MMFQPQKDTRSSRRRLVLVLLSAVGVGVCGLAPTKLSAAASVPPSSEVSATQPQPSTQPTQTSTTTRPSSPLKGLRLEPVATGLSGPVEVLASQADGRLYIVERVGNVKIAQGGRVAKQPFANLRSVIKSGSIEQGLLGMAFHPNYPTDRRVFFFHSKKDNDNVLVSYLVAADGQSIDTKSRVELLTVDKEPDAVRHNAGALRFAPDGLLYISVGDAARASKNGQNPKTLPGSMLRIDVAPAKGYNIPAGNPFADGKNGRPEVWWFGLRNPWRFSIDATSKLAYIGDVGQETYEEVNVVPYDKPGLNFGWPIFEGTKRYSKGEPASAVTPPVVEIKHGGENGSCSITGGEVYRGAAIPELIGHYFYADWCLGWIRSFRWDGSAAVDKRDWSTQLSAEMVSAFGHDASGELLVVDYEAGTVSRVGGIR